MDVLGLSGYACCPMPRTTASASCEFSPGSAAWTSHFGENSCSSWLAGLHCGRQSYWAPLTWWVGGQSNFSVIEIRAVQQLQEEETGRQDGLMMEAAGKQEPCQRPDGLRAQQHRWEVLIKRMRHSLSMFHQAKTKGWCNQSRREAK